MAQSLQKVVTLYPKKEIELGSPINERAEALIEPAIPCRVIISDRIDGSLAHSLITCDELLALDGITGNIEIRLSALEAVLLLMIPGACNPWTASAVAIGGETASVWSYTVPAGKRFLVDKVSFIGRADCICRFKIDSVTQEFMQIAWPMRSDEKLFPFGIDVTAGQVASITLENLGEAAADFYGNVYARLVDV